tara:strand:+ start:271 stop:522 length:252 start_codon:yes stop_codon:yes gene_type:complete
MEIQDFDHRIMKQEEGDKLAVQLLETNPEEGFRLKATIQTKIGNSQRAYTLDVKAEELLQAFNQIEGEKFKALVDRICPIWEN